MSQYMLIFDTAIDREVGVKNLQLIQQIESGGVKPEPGQLEILIIKYKLVDGDIILIFNNLLLIKQAKRSRVYLRE